jgi:hypothetical protein
MEIRHYEGALLRPEQRAARLGEKLDAVEADRLKRAGFTRGGGHRALA